MNHHADVDFGLRVQSLGCDGLDLGPVGDGCIRHPETTAMKHGFYFFLNPSD